MAERLRLALAQLDPHLGAITANGDKILAARARAAAEGADLVLTPELSIAGYPPDDLVLKPAFLDACREAVERLAAVTADGGPGLVVGAPWREGERLYNAALVLEGGRILAMRAKHELPNYGVFDDKRHFVPGPAPGPVAFRGFRLGLMICEDWWLPDVCETLCESGAELLVSINASPYEAGKQDRRLSLAVGRVVENGLGFVFLNQVGGQDELVFDGASFVLDPDRSLRVRLRALEEDFAIAEWRREEDRLVCTTSHVAPEEGREESIWRAMMLGLADYVAKNGFPGVVLGLSGGIDSAVTAAVAVDALGAERVRAVMLPSPYTSRESLEDAEACARALGVRYDVIPIAEAMDTFHRILAPVFGNRPPDITEENIQSRTRGLILMALSNKFGDMLLTTGNKSEMSVGYATLYGDMCGGFSVLKDVYKTTVFALARFRNRSLPRGAKGPEGPVIPERVIVKPPSAELKPNQTDQDTLPPYDQLDAILEGLVEGEQSVDALVARGHDRATVLRVWRMLDRAEYKRRQAPPGVKITPRAFGRDRRYPITNGFTALVR
ncbi:NAD+ synthase [Elioraea thermophila]|uniref:NAD+ synthase n=1 Tax=Elioraea thermophila TaxID=2185104 RepID=UPI000DF1BE91|nr:NAD+ synthase [Elioraea thermophila]